MKSAAFAIAAASVVTASPWWPQETQPATATVTSCPAGGAGAVTVTVTETFTAADTAIVSTGTAPGATSTGTGVANAPGATTTVTVGLDGGKVLKFDPPFLPKVNIGDQLQFDFRAVNHTLTESSFENPCAKLAGTDVDTNFQNANPMDIPNFRPFTLTVTEDKPRFFYCKQGNRTPNSHCGKGMIFAINVDGPTFGVFEQNAAVTGFTPLSMRRRRFAA